MKYLKITLLSLFVALISLPVSARKADRRDFQLGADISGVTGLESRGYFQKNREGATTECTRLMRDLGLNAVRLRVWVNPKDRFSSAQDVLEMARRAKANDMTLMVDFHYSDWWADPGKQVIPAAWAGLGAPQLADSVAAHTRSTLQLLKDNGIDVEFVQVGNETPNGFLWPVAKLDKGRGENMPAYAAIARAGYLAAKEVYPESIVIQHLDDAYNLQQYIDFFDGLSANGCPWDMIGMSVYPFWSERDQTDPSAVADVIANINALADRYSTPVVIAEVGVHVSDPANGRRFLAELIRQSRDCTAGRCRGVYYWAPESDLANGQYPLGAFADGQPTEIMDAYTDAAPDLAPASPRQVDLLSGPDWQFAHVDSLGSISKWQTVSVPHDWAVHEPFSRDNDLQLVAVEQNGETEKTEKTGRTGGLPYMGRGIYRTTFHVADTAARQFTLLFDGAMSNPQVKVNGQLAGGWAYGYNSFYINLPAGAVHPGENTLEVELWNKPQSSRWYPGAGLYRNVRLITTSRIHIPVWGTHLTTPLVTPTQASVKLVLTIDGADKGEKVEVHTDIIAPDGAIVATNRSTYVAHSQPFTQDFYVPSPRLWNLDDPNLYTARTRLIADGATLDEYSTRFGFRSLEYIPEKGFFLNGKYTKFRGVCNHHDLGPLGAAVNRSALRYQIELLKEMGVNAIRTSHNMPAPELVELCDEMGVMLMLEPFDDWGFRPKCLNGYGSIFDEWAERDMANMLRHYRNNPSVVMWSIGNEVPSQWGPDGVQELQMLLDICHREDPTRPVTCGMDQSGAVLYNGFAAALDIPGFNYKPHIYLHAYQTLPQKLVLGSETASTVSSRGVYHFPMELRHDAVDADHQSSSYDTDFCFWSNIPDLDFAMDDDYPWMIGQFVWTGFDYLGEPSPYDTDAWPNHSSLFGIIDLASLPKDRFYLYRSQWREDSPTLHVMPHWTWSGREGQTTPVMVYTSYPAAELFVNGRSQGVRAKAAGADIVPQVSDKVHFPEKSTRDAMDRYRLVWDDVAYEPGELRVVALDADGQPAEETTLRTAGKPYRLVLTPNHTSVAADPDELVYVTVSVEDREGNPVPDASQMVKFKVGQGTRFVATANGDPTCLLPFQAPEMQLFSGAATAIIAPAATGAARPLTLTATAPGLKSATITIPIY